MTTKTVKLSFKGPVHFGRGRLSDDGCACDAATIFSALFIEALHEGVQDELLQAARCGEFFMSDAFPYKGETMYLPKPIVGSKVFGARNEERAKVNAGDSRERKAYNKLSFVPASHYADNLAGTFDAVAALDNFKVGKSSLQTKVNLTRKESDDAKPYFVGGFSYFKDAGLYFIVRGSYDMAHLLELLSYAGLGGKRTSGYGRFEFDIVDSDPLEQLASSSVCAGTSVLLTTSAPRNDELSDELLDGARYQLVRKGGFVQSKTHGDTPQKKRDMYLFAAGATFSHTFEGDVFDVNATPGAHSVYRYAKAMWVEV